MRETNVILPKGGWHKVVGKVTKKSCVLFDWLIEFLVLVNASKYGRISQGPISNDNNSYCLSSPHCAGCQARTFHICSLI